MGVRDKSKTTIALEIPLKVDLIGKISCLQVLYDTGKIRTSEVASFVGLFKDEVGWDHFGITYRSLCCR